MSAATATIRFPPPPPTRNELTTEQRAKLIRTNNKLGQVLGTTPHVLDLSYIVPSQRPRHAEPAHPKTPTSTMNPFRSHSRAKSLPKVDVNAVRANSPDSVASTNSASSRTSSSSARSARPIADNEQSWRSPYPAQRPPLLKLSTPSSARKPGLETIPGSPPFDQLTAAIEPPSFTIPSDAAARREKMRRLRRKLGENIPTDLIFPSSPDESDSEEDSPLISTPTSTMSREWLFVHKPLPEEPHVASGLDRPLPLEPELERPLPKAPPAKESSSTRRRLFKEREPPKVKPSKGAKRLASIAESSAEAHRGEQIICVGVAASTGMRGMGKSRRFVQGELAMDQIGGAWGGFGIGW
ncbi:hypothetical protein BC628DRAFT_239877 [Trametes gibbosa]|nr:hypothetical protein BC628DRAFT_239877 [Trametes gibbosa]